MFDKAIELEKILIRRMEERDLEGKVCDEIADFFEDSGENSVIPVIVGAKKGKSSNLCNANGEGAFGRGPGGAVQIALDTPYPPLAILRPLRY